MPSFDIVSEIDMMEVENAINQAQKEIAQRFDFRGGKSSIELDKAGKKIKIIADDELKLRSIHQIISAKMAKRDLDLRALKYGKEEAATGNARHQGGNGKRRGQGSHQGYKRFEIEGSGRDSGRAGPRHGKEH